MSIQVPVIMYHSVGQNNPNWRWNYLITPVNVFEAQIKLLLKKGFNSINLQELYDHMKYNKRTSDNPIVLTFDDGYLDNWVYAFPILKKYGLKGTIFVNPEFVDPTDKCRQNLDDLWSGRCKENDLFSTGFLSWPEIRKMEESGVIDIQSHSMSHTWFFSSDEIIDFNSPGSNQYAWLFWNACPERKSFYMSENQEDLVPYGTPIYANARSLGMRRYLEDKCLTEYLVNYAKQEGLSFFKRRDWKEQMFNLVDLYKKRNIFNNGRYETDEEYEERYKYELIESKKILEEKLSKRINFLCWAGGAYNDDALRIAEEGGYLSSTLFYDDKNRINTFGEDPSKINRIGCASAFYWHNCFISYTDPEFFIANIRRFNGSEIHLWIMRLYKIKYLIKFSIERLFGRR